MSAAEPDRKRRLRRLRSRTAGLIAFALSLSMAIGPLAQAAGNPARSSKASPIIFVKHGPNASAQQGKHYVVLIALGGFRYGYTRKYAATELLALGRDGASAPDGMVPSYPSYTAPNLYTLVTGLYPGRHGIVADRFYDPRRKQYYNYDNPKSMTDGRWYGGVPLWVLAEKGGMRSASISWLGSQAEIDGERPAYYLEAGAELSDHKKIEQVVQWLRLPSADRPHLITLYLGGVDRAGHKFGPDSAETAGAVKHVDRLVGDLWEQLKELKLPIDLIVVSDHGMAQEQGPWIDLDKYAGLTGFITAGSLLYPESEAAAEKAYEQLKIKSSKFKVYRRRELPAELAASANPSIGDPVILATGPYPIRAHSEHGISQAPPAGLDGFDPAAVKSMRAIFIAAGPDIRHGVRLRPFENVNVYPLIAYLLGLHAPKNDGNLNILSGILLDPP